MPPACQGDVNMSSGFLAPGTRTSTCRCSPRGRRHGVW